jgi:hypothetical protein
VRSGRLFCARPFEAASVSRTGDVYLCCADWLPVPVGSVLEATLSEVWEGEAAARVRVSVLDQSFRHCGACPFLSPPRVPVRAVGILAGNFNPVRVGELTLSYDPTCNLACPSCRSGPAGATSLTERIHAEVVRSVPLVDRLYVAGYGDPAASPYYWSLLRDLESLSPSPWLTVHLHTNGLLLTPEKWLELGDVARRVSAVTVSVDAARAETYAINRGGDWRLLLDNLSFLSRLRGVRLTLNFVVQDNNFLEVPAFARLALEYSAGAYFAGIQLRDDVSPGRGGLHPVMAGPDYGMRAVHRTFHPRYGLFREIMADPILRDPRVTLADYMGEGS